MRYYFKFKIKMEKVMPIKEHKLKIIEIIDEATEVKTFRLKLEDEIKFYAGQFFMVYMEDNPKLRRAYSISSSPENKEFIDITVHLVGKFTNKLFECKIGDYLMFKGPYGKFYFTEDIKNNIIMIGGGCGTSSLMSIIRFCKDRNLPNKIKVICSFRSPDYIVYREEFEKWDKEDNKFDYVQTITRPKPEHNWNGLTERINVDLLKKNIDDIENNIYYLCGPMEFVKNTISMLEEIGAKKEQIKTDFWGS